ncbi:hypothetical protein EAG_00077, partial [Camponotus floridanus]
QIFGTPMGSSLSPICADLVLQDPEEKVITMLHFDLPFFYRYVDDVVLMAPASCLDFLLQIFNSLHDRLQFEMEIAEN